jgi:hypothetical protein
MDNLKASIQGAFKSITIWAGAALLVLSNIAPIMPELLADIGFDAKTVQRWGSLTAAIMLICRTITTTSLAQKGTNSPLVNPPPEPPK